MSAKKSKTTKSKPTTNQPIFDVAKPGKSTPTVGSRPVIITQRPMIGDPMVSKQSIKITDSSGENSEDKISGNAKTDLPLAKEDLSKKTELVVNPIEVATKAPSIKEELVVPPETKTEEIDPQKEKAIEKAEEAVDEAVKDEPSAEDKDTDEQEDSEKSLDGESDNETDDTENGTPEDTGANSEPDNGLVDELAKQAASKKQQNEESKLEDIQRDKIEELIAARTYYVPTTQAAQRTVKYVFVIILVLLILGVVGLNFAVDAELIDIGISPFTNLL